MSDTIVLSPPATPTARVRGAARRARHEISRTDAHGRALALHVRVALVVGGVVAVAAGATGLVVSGIGAGPVDVLLAALARTTGFAHGTLGMLAGLSFLIGAMALGRRPGPATVAASLGTGQVMNVLLAHAPVVDGGPAGWAVHLVGLTLIGFGVAALVHADLGTGALELFSNGLAERLRANPVLVRTGFEVSVVAAAVLAGGRFGWGTALVAATIGPAVGAGTVVLRGVLHPLADTARPPLQPLRFTRW